MSSKLNAYQELVQKRKAHNFADLKNPSETDYDVNHLDPWAQWQSNLDAKILVIGQEFCDFETYINVKGTVERYPDKFEYPSNQNLYEYFKILGYDLGHPLKPTKSNPIYFTNAVMGLKSGTMSSNFKMSWVKESQEHFLKPLIEIIQPKAIITIGSIPTISVCRIYSVKTGNHKNMVENSPYITVSGIKIFPVYHTGGLGLRNRKKELQIKDWEKIRDRIF